MKIHSAFLTALAIVGVTAQTADAQFFKKLVNDVKQTVENRADDKTVKATNKGLDKVDGTASAGSTGSSGGGTATAGTPAKDQDAQNSLFLKKLMKLPGSMEVSAADSAAAIHLYMNSSGGNGTHYTYQINSSRKGGTAFQGTTNTYFTNNGTARSEINFTALMGMAKKDDVPLVVLANASRPNYSMILDDKGRQYSLNVVDTAVLNSAGSDYQVTKLGTETVGGYTCSHARLKSTGRFSKNSGNMEMWLSTDVPGYSNYKKWMSVTNVTSKMMKSLAQAGCSGFIVKMLTQGKDYSYSTELTKAEQGSFPSSLFRVPSGYAKSDGNLMFANMMQAGMNARKK